MGASARMLVEEDGVVRGLRYRDGDGLHEIRAPLTVGADGRFSRLRRLAWFEPRTTSPPAFMRLLPRIPILRRLRPHLIAFGIWPVHLRRGERTPKNRKGESDE